MINIIMNLIIIIKRDIVKKIDSNKEIPIKKIMIVDLWENFLNFLNKTRMKCLQHLSKCLIQIWKKWLKNSLSKNLIRFQIMIKIIILEIPGLVHKIQPNNGSFDKNKKSINLKILKTILKIKTVLNLNKNLLKKYKIIHLTRIFLTQIIFLEIIKFFMINLIILIKNTFSEKKRIIKIKFIIAKISNLFKKIKAI